MNMSTLDWKDLLSGFNGRINRAKYWLWILLLFIFNSLLVLLMFPFIRMGWGGVLIYIVGYAIILPVALWTGLATAIKRLHDRDKSGWWMVLFWLVPFMLQLMTTTFFPTKSYGFGTIIGLAGVVIGIWGFIEIACLAGTRGPNRFGPDPLDLGQTRLPSQ